MRINVCSLTKQYILKLSRTKIKKKNPKTKIQNKKPLLRIKIQYTQDHPPRHSKMSRSELESANQH
jgi:hypothetical protein